MPSIRGGPTTGPVTLGGTVPYAAPMRPRLRLVLAGAAIDNGNRGVEALGLSVVQGIHEAAPDSDLTILDDGWGVRPDRSLGLEGVRADLVGVRRSRRWYRPESWARVRWSLAVGGGRNPVAERLVRAHAVLDISGGDSFTDTYGPTRLRTICAPKHAALHARRPLVLLPQTIGPFQTRQGRAVAANIVRRVALAYARDPDSHERLLALAGPDVDRGRLRQGVDVAFALGATAPDEDVRALLDRRDGEALAGVNVSGLLLSPGMRDRFGVHDDYLATMVEVVRRLVREEGARVALVPHVHVPGGGGESDRVAIETDGTVEENTLSPARYLNQSRDGEVFVTLVSGEYGISPGQACVFYADDSATSEVWGGGFIAEAVPQVFAA